MKLYHGNHNTASLVFYKLSETTAKKLATNENVFGLPLVHYSNHNTFYW